MSAPGNTAGTGMTELALRTGAGWENLYLRGPYDSAQQANDGFVASLAGGGNLGRRAVAPAQNQPIYSNPSRPIRN